jgi:hypothetical protein
MTNHNYDFKTKSELWVLVKEAGITSVSWKSTKDEMIVALTENNKALEDAVDSEVLRQAVEENTGFSTVNDLANADFSVWSDIISDVVPNDVEEIKELVTIPPVSISETNLQAETPLDNTIISDSKISTEIDHTQVQFYNWHYIDHQMSGGFKPVTDETEIDNLVLLLDTLNSVLPEHKRFIYNKRIVSIKMKPKTITVEGVNDQKIKRTEKQKQTNNDYGNRRKTIMSTNESSGRNVGQPSVKESILFKAARFLSEPFIRNGKVNLEGIDTISVDKHQVYPVSLTTALPENHPALQLLSPETIAVLFGGNKIETELTETQQSEIKAYKRRKDIAQQKVSQRSFSHLRGKINNGFSPSFKDGDKTFCFELDKLIVSVCGL